MEGINGWMKGINGWMEGIGGSKHSIVKEGKTRDLVRRLVKRSS